jgi:large subunit ribosomal protein L37Ae
MARRTKKVGITGRFGPRYGVKLKRQIRQIESEKIKRHDCPQCKRASIKRKHTSIWECSHCGYKFAGGAYSPTIARKQFIHKLEAEDEIGEAEEEVEEKSDV